MLKRGNIYLLRGGYVLRYLGQAPSGALSFIGVTYALLEPTMGKFFGEGEVLRELTKEDVDWVKVRREQARSRNLLSEVNDMDAVLEEIDQ
jgi:hypothetical protein